MPTKKKSGLKVNKSVSKTRSAVEKATTPLRKKRAYARPDFASFHLQISRRPFSDEQCKTFFNRLEELGKTDVHLIYRGDNKDRILRKFNLQPHAFPTVFNDYLFMIGDKGRHFWEKAVKKGQQTLPVFGLGDTMISRNVF